MTIHPTLHVICHNIFLVHVMAGVPDRNTRVVATSLLTLMLMEAQVRHVSTRTPLISFNCPQEVNLHSADD